ncbi:MAG TPA: redoxin family protein [Steroidobacteraceae bacterium]|nr:redoxin family protein [Steroidobacteraceae bacterium]
MQTFMRQGLFALIAALPAASQADTAPARPAEFTHDRASEWVNSRPLTLAELRGKVVVVEFWAFECDNCIRSRPWVEQLERDDASRGLVVVGVHTPELPDEHDALKVRDAIRALHIHDPVMVDEDGSYWRAMKIQVWPTWCLIARDGLLVSCVPGEMDLHDARATRVRAAIDMLLAAPAG